MKVSIRFKQDEPTTEAILKYLSQFTNNYILYDLSEKNNNTKIFYIDNDGCDEIDSSDEDNSNNSCNSQDNPIGNPNVKKEITLMADYGIYNITYKNSTLVINYQCNPIPIGLMDSIDRFETLTVTSDSLVSKEENLELIKQFVLETDQWAEPTKDDKISCYIADEGYWKFLSANSKRKIETVFHPKRDELYQDIVKFNDSEKDYNKHGIPYKRNYLFYGPPGTGKTSMLCALASEFNAKLYMINFTSKVTDAVFMKLVSKIPSGSIMVLEDIDALFTERVSNDAANYSMVSFSAILNTLDGIARKNKLITIMTTNFKDRLDEALIRPGRIDMVLEFPLASDSQVKDMFGSYFGSGERAMEILKQLFKKTRKTEVSTAALQKYFFEARDDVELVEKNMDKLTDIISQYNKTVHQLYL